MLQYDEPPSYFASNFNLRQYNEERVFGAVERRGVQREQEQRVVEEEQQRWRGLSDVSSHVVQPSLLS
jgi:hypothetical protein